MHSPDLDALLLSAEIGHHPEEAYLHAYDSVAAAKSGIGKYFSVYNNRRPHTALDRHTPDTVFFDSQPLAAAA